MRVKTTLALATFLLCICGAIFAAQLVPVSDTNVTVIPVGMGYSPTTLTAWGSAQAVEAQWQYSCAYGNAANVRSNAYVHYFCLSAVAVGALISPADANDPSKAAKDIAAECHAQQASLGVALWAYADQSSPLAEAVTQPSKVEEFVSSAGCSLTPGISPGIIAHEFGHGQGEGHQAQFNTIAASASGVFAQAIGVQLPDGTCDIMSTGKCFNQGVVSGPQSCIGGQCYSCSGGKCNNAAVGNATRDLVASYAPTPRDTSLCVADATTFCLDHGRFKVRAQWVTAEPVAVEGQPDPISTGWGQTLTLVKSTGATVDGGGVAWFFSSDNPELLIKVINGCVLNSYYWVFFSAGTDVGFQITVTDTLTGRMKVYQNNVGVAAVPIEDTSAFAACP